MMRQALIAIAVTASLGACKAEQAKTSSPVPPAKTSTTSTTVPSALRKLHAEYKDGDIDECKHAGKLAYSAGINAYDAGASVYDRDGNLIGTCNYASNAVDPICEQLQGCQTVYRCADHITGEPPVDKYGLND